MHEFRPHDLNMWMKEPFPAHSLVFLNFQIRTGNLWNYSPSRYQLRQVELLASGGQFRSVDRYKMR